MIFLEYPKCSTCKNIKKYLEDKNLEIKSRHIVENNPSFEEIKDIYEKSGLDIKKFFNTSGLKYKELGLKDKLPNMTIDEKLELLASDGMLIKRPILIDGDNILIAKEILKQK